MPRSNFENELKQLQVELIQMGSLVERAIEQSIEAFKTHDLLRCEQIVENDKEIDELERQIESACLWLIARQQPVASDLRGITTALKIATDMERIGDHASDIAELTMRIDDKNAFADSSHIPQMAAAAVKMVHSAVNAFVNADLDLAERTEKQDDEVDAYFNMIKEELVNVFNTQPQNMDNAVDYMLIAKYLERIADHAVNICEWVHFSQTGAHKNTQIF
ncbi:phosphate transport system regulatory protein PhoU [Clostridia bacterium]|nr:phosphate transport system regulatory protein PhoU [Clostridia bacterium]